MTPGILGKLGFTGGGGSMGLTNKGIFGGIAALSSLPLFMGQEEDNLDDATGQAARGPSIQDVFGMNLNQIAKGARAGTLDPNVFNFLQTAADGGRIGYAGGGIGDLRGALSKQMFGYDDEEEIKKLALGGSAGLPPVTMVSEGTDSMSFPDDESTGMAQATPAATLPNQMPRPMMDPRMMQMMMAQRKNPMMGGRIGFINGGDADYPDDPDDPGHEGEPLEIPDDADLSPDDFYGSKEKPSGIMMASAPNKGLSGVLPIWNLLIKELEGTITPEELKLLKKLIKERGKDSGPWFAQGGRIGAQEGGMMDMGGLEKDYRNEGGFVPIGGQERADDVPARLSKNEFVFTADAVRNAGGGDIDKGAEIMENMMENLEAGGKVSKASQGLSGAREMFATQQRLGEVL